MKVRIAKFLSDNGVASRREAERMIESGGVSVNGEIITSPVFFVDGSEKITVYGKLVVADNKIKLYAFYKPINTMTTASDPMGRKTIYDVLPKEYKNLKYIGRLDYRTTGLLLMTNDGELSRILTLPSSNIPRTYIALVEGNDFSGLEKVRQGITVDGIKYRPMKIDTMKNNELKITITEGKKNEIRVVLDAVGLPVKKLHRISYGNINLGNLSVGKIKEISQKHIDELSKSF